MIMLAGMLLVPVLECQHARVKFEPCAGCKPIKAARSRKTKTLHHHFFFWGLVPFKKVLKAEEICPNGIESVYEYSSLMDGLLENFTIGLYCPKTMEVKCY